METEKIVFNNEDLNELLLSSNFLDEYQKYKLKINNLDLNNFLDNIDNNKGYYHLNINKKKVNIKSNNNDTIYLKKVNNLINKITEKTFPDIKNELVNLINEKKYLNSLVIENIIEISIMNQIYINLYIEILKDINKNNEINKYCNKYFNIFFNEHIEKNDSKYLELCNINKRTDNIIGFSLLISHLEKNNIVNNFIDKIISEFFNNILTNHDEENNIKFFQYLLSIETIFNMHPDKLNQIFIDKLNNIKLNHKSSKIRFKIMDILNE